MCREEVIPPPPLKMQYQWYVNMRSVVPICYERGQSFQPKINFLNIKFEGN